MAEALLPGAFGRKNPGIAVWTDIDVFSSYIGPIGPLFHSLFMFQLSSFLCSHPVDPACNAVARTSGAKVGLILPALNSSESDERVKNPPLSSPKSERFACTQPLRCACCGGQASMCASTLFYKLLRFLESLIFHISFISGLCVLSLPPAAPPQGRIISSAQIICPENCRRECTSHSLF